MSPQLLHVSDKITILGGGAVNRPEIDRALGLAPALVAADGGADTALAAGYLPDAVIGDFDSISDAARRAIPADRQFPIAEQDSTDFEKCLRAVRADLVLGVGFLGARFDHALAALHILARYSDRRCILLGERDICFHCPPTLALDLPEDTRFSLFPLARVTGRSRGLRWPIDGIVFSPDGRVGTSNAVTGPVRLHLDAPGMIAILPEQFLETAVGALMAAGPAGD